MGATERNMSRPPTGTVVRYVRRLDRQELTALLVALHRESGHDVRVSEGLVIARRGESTTVLLPVAGQQDDRPVGGERAVSAVVTTGDGSGRARDLAEQLGADLRTAADLVEMLFYAVDREVTVRLCEEFLGRPPGAMRAPPVQCLRDRLAALGANPPVGALGVVLVLAVCVGTVAVALPASPEATPAGSSVDGTPTPDGSPGTADTAPTPVGESLGSDEPTPTPSRPPGVGPDGNVDIWTLAVAHRRVLRTTDFRLERRYTGPEVERGTVVGNLTSQYQLVAVSDGTHFARWRTARCDGPETARERYFDGTRLYEVRYDGTDRTADRIPLEGNEIYPRAAETSATVVRRHLDAPTVTARPVPGDSTGRYRVVARGRPADMLLPPVTNYTARALVRPSGVVERLRVTYRTDGREVNASLSHSFVFEPPDSPPWYRELAGTSGGNGTVGAEEKNVTGTPFSEQIETVAQTETKTCGEPAGSNESLKTVPALDCCRSVPDPARANHLEHGASNP